MGKGGRGIAQRCSGGSASGRVGVTPRLGRQEINSSSQRNLSIADTGKCVTRGDGSTGVPARVRAWPGWPWHESCHGLPARDGSRTEPALSLAKGWPCRAARRSACAPHRRKKDPCIFIPGESRYRSLLPPEGSVSVCCRGGFTPPFGEVNSPLHHQTETLPTRGATRDDRGAAGGGAGLWIAQNAVLRPKDAARCPAQSGVRGLGVTPRFGLRHMDSSSQPKLPINDTGKCVTRGDGATSVPARGWSWSEPALSLAKGWPCREWRHGRPRPWPVMARMAMARVVPRASSP